MFDARIFILTVLTDKSISQTKTLQGVDEHFSGRKRKRAFEIPVRRSARHAAQVERTKQKEKEKERERKQQQEVEEDKERLKRSSLPFRKRYLEVRFLSFFFPALPPNTSGIACVIRSPLHRRQRFLEVVDITCVLQSPVRMWVLEKGMRSLFNSDRDLSVSVF